jgi:quercetin dioxygenase-like cupin family protein
MWRKLVAGEKPSEMILMNELDLARRSFLFGLGGLAIGQALPPADAEIQGTGGRVNVLGSNQGEHLIHFRDRGNIFIKLSAANGSDHFAVGTQQVMAGGGIPVHRHFEMDEAFYILQGGGNFLLNDEHQSFEKGATIFIPKNTWHGFETPNHELLLLWMVSPAGLDGFFRETCSPPGVTPKQLTRGQIKEIARKYGTEFR